MSLLRWVLILLSACLSLPAQIPVAAGGEPAYRLRIPATYPSTLKGLLVTHGYDADCCGDESQSVHLIASQADFDQLRGAGFAPQVLEQARPFGAPGGTRNGNPIPTGYNDLAAINASLNATASTFPTLAAVHDATASWGPGSTYEGRAINIIKISDNVGVDEDEPEVLFVSCHHCREIVTPEIALDIIARLTTGYGNDPTITALVDQYEIWVAPVCNPDGLEYVWNVNNLWRKNRKDFGNGQFGVDLNRNYDLNWQALCGASNSPSSNVYRGPAPGSEEETQTIVGLSQARNFAKVMDFHSYGQEVLQTYNCAPLPPTIESWIDNEAVALANTASYATRDPSADGEHYQWQIKTSTSYAFLTETHTVFQPTYASALAEVASVWPLNLAFLQRPIPLVGHVTDSQTGAPVAAQVSIVGVTWSNGETRRSEPQFGRYHLHLPAGTHQVTFDAPGYVSQTVSVTVTANGTTVQDVMLTAGGPFTFVASTSGGGVGDFSMDLYNLPTGTEVGFTLFSLQTSQPVGTGNLFGIVPDLLTFDSLLSPPGPTNPLHWSQPFVPGVFPLGTFTLPPGAVQVPAGTQVDGVAIAAAPFYLQLLGQSQVVRLTF